MVRLATVTDDDLTRRRRSGATVFSILRKPAIMTQEEGAEDESKSGTEQANSMVNKYRPLFSSYRDTRNFQAHARPYVRYTVYATAATLWTRDRSRMNLQAKERVFERAPQRSETFDTLGLSPAMSGSENDNGESLETVCISRLFDRFLVSFADRVLRLSCERQEAKYFCRKRIMNDHYAISCALACPMHLVNAPSPLRVSLPRRGGRLVFSRRPLRGMNELTCHGNAKADARAIPKAENGDRSPPPVTGGRFQRDSSYRSTRESISICFDNVFIFAAKDARSIFPHYVENLSR